MQWDTVSFTWEWKPNFPWPLSFLPYLMQDGLQRKKETLQKKVKSSSGALATVTSILWNKMKIHARMLKSACNALPVSLHCPRRASMTTPGTARRRDLWLCICELVVLIYGALGRQSCQPACASEHNLQLTCTPVLCPLLLTRGTWEAFSLKNLKMANETPMQAGHPFSFLSTLIISQLMKRLLFRAWPEHNFQLPLR